MKVICSSVSMGSFRCNATHDLALRVADSRLLGWESLLYPRSANTFAKRSLDGFRIRRRMLVHAGADTLIATPPEVSPPLPVEAKSAEGSLSVIPEASAPLESATDGQNVASGVVQRSDLPSDLTSNIRTVVDSAKQFSTDATEKATKMLNETSNLVQDKVEDVSKTLQRGYDTIAAEGGQKVDEGRQAVESAVGEGRQAVESAISSTEEAYTQLFKQLLDSIPPEYKEYADVAKTYVSSATDFASANRVPLLLGTLVITGYGLYAFYRYRFQGYSGDILPKRVLAILQTDAPALLVDVRSEKKQDSAGIPKLRRSALGKAVPLPLCTPSNNPIKILTSSSRETCIAMTAAYISGLSQATETTNFVILAENDRDGRDVARALERNEGRNAFVMLGGFQSWVNSGLPVGNVKEYDVTPIDAISEKAQDIVEPLKDPKLLAVTAVVVTATGWSVWNYRYILQLLGFLGPTLTLLAYLVKKYDTLDDFVTDIGSFIDTEKRASLTSRIEARPQTNDGQVEKTREEATDAASIEGTETTPEINKTSLAES